MWLEYLTAFRNITRQHRRSAFAISAVSFAVIALVLATGFIQWIFWAAREGAIQAGLGHVHVVRSGYLTDGQADPSKYVLSDEASERDEIQRLPNVRVVAPRVAFNGLVSNGDATLSFLGEGVDVRLEGEVSPSLAIAAGQNLSAESPNGILLGSGLAANLGVQVGDKVALLTNTVAGSPNGMDCVVRGLFNSASKAYDDSAVRVPLPIARQLLGMNGSHRWIIVLDDTDDTASTVRALERRFGNGQLQFVPWYDLADFYNKVFALLSRQIGVVQFIIAIIVVLSISNTMMMSVLERTAEIGTSMALGRTRWQMLRQFLFEGCTIGLIGGALGLLIGWLLAITISTFGIPMPPPPGMSQGYRGKILLDAPLAVNAFVMALGTTVLASLYPAWKASRMKIVDALRHNR
jgi:putative ABC transport system permease protein